jgi:hypothetical protein
MKKLLLTLAIFVSIFSLKGQNSPRLNSAMITFNTTTDDKDWDTKPYCYIKLDGRTIASIDCCSSDRNGDHWNDGSTKSIQLTIHENAFITEIFKRGTCVLGGQGGSHGQGNDTWKFNATLQIEDSYGIKKTFNWNGIEIYSYSRSMELQSFTTYKQAPIIPPPPKQQQEVWLSLFGTGKSNTTSTIKVTEMDINISKGFYVNTGSFQGVEFQGMGENTGLKYTLNYGNTKILPGTYKISILGKCTDYSAATHRSQDNQEIHAGITYK